MGIFGRPTAKRPESESPRGRRQAMIRVERLEGRELLATGVSSFTPPDLTPFIQAANKGVNAGPATIQKMGSELQTQLTAGPLADLKAGTIDATTFQSNVASLVSSFQANVATQLSPRFPNITKILTLQGTKVESLLEALGTQNSVGLITSVQLTTQAADAINSLTGGPLLPLDTTLQGYVTATQAFENQINSLVPTLASNATTPLTLAQVQQVVAADSNAYADAMAASLYLHPKIDRTVNSAVATLTTTVSNFTTSDTTSPAVELTNAVKAFDTTILDTTGLFGPLGAVSKVVSPRPVVQASTTLAAVSGTATNGGPATLTATLTSTNTGKALTGKTVTFTIDGAYVGIAVTDSNGVASLTTAPTLVAVGTDTDGVVASYAGDNQNKAASASGNLTVS
jgi:hypothetical protein